MNDEIATPEDILSFWLNLDKAAYYKADPAFDEQLTRRFSATLTAARAGALDDWSRDARGALALIIVLDQFSRNIYRASADMFSADQKALDLAKEAIAKGFDTQLGADCAIWFYLPFMHAENFADQVQCIVYCQTAGLHENLPFAIEHADIIRRFGRFPHRNAVLGRTSSEQEELYLAGGGFAG